MTATGLDSEDRTEWAAIAGVIATVSVFAIAQGLTYPLLSFILQRQGVSPSLIGLSAAMTPVGFIVSSPLIPWIARRFGAGRAGARLCRAVGAGASCSIGWTQDVYAWFPLRFLLGLVTNPLYVLSEVWMIALAPPARRGRVMGIYTTIISAGFAAGPLCLLIVGIAGLAAFPGRHRRVRRSAALCLALVLQRLPKDRRAPAITFRCWVSCRLPGCCCLPCRGRGGLRAGACLRCCLSMAPATASPKRACRRCCR